MDRVPQDRQRVQKNGIVLALALLLAGCSNAPHSLSGAYVASDQQSASMLEITQSPDGQLLGTLVVFAIKPDGSNGQVSLSLTGTTDGKSLTLVVKPNELFAVSRNISGTVDGRDIVLSLPNGNIRFGSSSSDVYQDDVRALSVRGIVIQQHDAEVARINSQRAAEQQRIDDENQKATGLTNALNAYATKIENNPPNWLQQVRETQSKILTAARYDLELEKRLGAGNQLQQVQAAQGRVRINQLDIQMSQFNMQLSNEVRLGHEHIQQFDAAIAQSPCVTDEKQLSACVGERAAELRFQQVRASVLNAISEQDAAAKQGSAEMDKVNKEAGN